MCGIVGAAGDLPLTFTNNAFRDFLDICQVRGRDSTGVIKVNKDTNDYDWCKQIGAPTYLFDTRLYEQRIEKGSTPSILIGHCRARTVGEVSVKNAHPFDFPDEGICGVHNGTLRSHYKLDTYHHTLVDSEVLYAYMAKHGADKTFTDIEGAFACVWWNSKEKTLNFIRNKERPLWFTWSEDARMMFWASEAWMFAAIERKHKLWDGGKDKQKFIQIPEDTLWSFKINASAKGDEKVLTMRPAKKLCHVPEKKFYQGGQQASSNGSATSDSGWSYDAKTKTSVRKGGEVANPFLDRIKKKYVGWDHLPIQRKQEIIRREKLNSDPLDDQINDLYGLTKENQTSTDISNVSFLTTSARNKDSKTEQNSSNKQKKPLLSLPSPSSKDTLTKNNVVPLDKLLNCSTSQSQIKKTLQLKSGVSFRTVAGIEYITDNKTKKEVSCDMFLHNTGSTCCFCKTIIDDIDQVGEILDDNNFICKTCLIEPKDIAL